CACRSTLLPCPWSGSTPASARRSCTATPPGPKRPVAERARIAPAWLATVVLVTLNLRPFLTAVGPLTPAIQAHTGLSLQALAWLTLLPMALMGAGTWLAPAVLHRVGA